MNTSWRLGFGPTTWQWLKTFALAGLVFFAAKSYFVRESGPATEQLAPPFNLTTTDGTALSLETLRGQPILVEAMASWCSACKRSARAVSSAATAERRRPVQFLSVVIDATDAEAMALKQAWAIPGNVAADAGDFARSYKISLLPTFILIDETGKVLQVETGAADQGDIEGWLSSVGAHAN